MLSAELPPRRRNAIGTRQAILQAARVAFTTHGFDQVGIRDITAAAGVNASLVNRYFGTKQKLFAEAMQVHDGLAQFFDVVPDEFAGKLADYVLDKNMDGPSFDPILALIRSAPVEQAQPILRDYLTREAIQPLAACIGGDDAEQRAGLLMSLLIGLTVMRGLIRSEPLASSKRADLAVLIALMIDATIGQPIVVCAPKTVR